MTPRLQAWIRQAENDLAMADFARTGGFFAQACYGCSQAAEKALKGLLMALGQEPPRSHSLERLVDALAEVGLLVEPLRSLQLKALSRMSTATRYPDGDIPMAMRRRPTCSTPGTASRLLGLLGRFWPG